MAPAALVLALLAGLATESRGLTIRAGAQADWPPGQDPQQHNFAWLISGQVARFIYKDSTSMLDGGVTGLVGCDRYPPRRCPATLDVHVVLANTLAQQWTGAPYRSPSYSGRGIGNRSVANHFRSLGATHVRLKILSNAEFDQKIHSARDHIMERGMQDSNMTKERWDNYLRKIRYFQQRFLTNGNMMYLRHVAYKSAVEFELTQPSKYTHFLYTRDDNVFVHPKYTLLQLAHDMDGGRAPSDAPPVVMVDKFCGFHSYSDKIYFATRKGFDALFAKTEEQHIQMMANWITGVPTSKWTMDPMQSEAFFKLLLDTAEVNVLQSDLGRTEARYAMKPGTSDLVLCTPSAYWKCTSSRPPPFPVCP